MNNDQNILANPVSSKDYAQGPADAPITLVEYGDYQCPYCSDSYFALKELKERLGDNLRFVFRNFPLSELHPYAFLAAEAAEAAGAQGKFWEMYSMLYENQTNLQPQALVSYATALKLDTERFIEDINSGIFAARIKQDVQSGVMSGVNGTPALFINGERYEGQHDIESLLNALQVMSLT